jgi:acylpyruvate hydrolase
MKIICIGRNYAEHIRELNSAMPTTPVFFLKPDTALLTRNRPFFYPGFTKEIHHEVELVLKVCKAKKKGLPWALSKGFDHAAPVSRFVSKSKFPDLKNITFHLDLNGKTVQTGNSSLMLYPFDDIITYISQFMTLRTGDLIFTGTPAGVGPIKIGDLLEGYLGEDKMLTTRVK